MKRHIALNFHGLGKPHQAVDDAERPYWLSEAAFRALVARIAGSPDHARFLITFDDGNESDLLAAEILAEHGLAGQFYALAGRLDDPHHLSGADLRSLAGMGMHIGLHGHDHVDWRQLDDAGLDRELVDARNILADALGGPVDQVAIPLGAYNRRVMQRLKREGFTHILTSDRGMFDPADLIWNRNTIRCDTSEAHLAGLLRGDLPLGQRLRGPLSQFLRRQFV